MTGLKEEFQSLWLLSALEWEWINQMSGILRNVN